MLKLIVILVLVIYLLNKLSFFLFRVMGRTQPPPNFRRPMNNGTNADDPAKRTPKRGGGLKGGEYVDYEEVK
jgi:hypothetical protein